MECAFLVNFREYFWYMDKIAIFNQGHGIPKTQLGLVVATTKALRITAFIISQKSFTR